MTERFFVDSPISDQRVTLEAAEARHLCKVMRARPGDEVTLFDGGGCEFVARVERIGRSSVELRIERRLPIDRESSVPIILGTALPKGDRQRWLVEKSVELGVRRLVPLITTRAVARPTDSATERMRRFVIEASKQCGRNRLMRVDEATTLDDFLRTAATEGDRWLLDPTGQPFSDVRWSGGELSIAVGPEGGFTAEERRIAHDLQWRTLSLGPRVLRVETAAAAAAAIAGAMSG